MNALPSPNTLWLWNLLIHFLLIRTCRAVKKIKSTHQLLYNTTYLTRVNTRNQQHEPVVYRGGRELFQNVLYTEAVRNQNTEMLCNFYLIFIWNCLPACSNPPPLNNTAILSQPYSLFSVHQNQVSWSECLCRILRHSVFTALYLSSQILIRLKINKWINTKGSDIQVTYNIEPGGSWTRCKKSYKIFIWLTSNLSVRKQYFQLAF